MSTDLPYPSEIELRKFLDDLPNLPIFVRGEIPAEEQLPNVAEYHRYDALHWRGHLWVKRLDTSESWTDAGKVRVLTPQYPAKPPEVDTDKLDLSEEKPSLGDVLNILGTWPHDQEFPDAKGYKRLDTYFWRGQVFVMLDGKWEGREVVGSVERPAIPSPQFDEFITEIAEGFGEDGMFNIVGRTDCLPYPAMYREHDAFIVRDEIWIRSFDTKAIEVQPVWVRVNSPKLEAEQIRLYDERQKKVQPEPEEMRREDKGAVARELMEHKAEVKRLRRMRIKYLCFLWLVILLIVGGFGTAAYAYIQRDLVIGRYSDSRECSLKVGNFTITGKRTYSYPAYSLWGQRWVQESNVQEVTTINLPGSKLDILMDAEPKWIGYRFSDGERGTQILKPALKYAFVMDKGMAMATYGGFCQPLDKQAVPDDPKNQERTIIN